MYRHLLIAVDGSLLSESAFKKALVFAKEMNATLTLLRAIPQDHLTVYQAEMLGTHQPQHTDQARKNATAYLQGLETEARHALVPCPYRLVGLRKHGSWGDGLWEGLLLLVVLNAEQARVNQAVALARSHGSDAALAVLVVLGEGRIRSLDHAQRRNIFHVPDKRHPTPESDEAPEGALHLEERHHGDGAPLADASKEYVLPTDELRLVFNYHVGLLRRVHNVRPLIQARRLAALQLGVLEGVPVSPSLGIRERAIREDEPGSWGDLADESGEEGVAKGVL